MTSQLLTLDKREKADLYYEEVKDAKYILIAQPRKIRAYEVVRITLGDSSKFDNTYGCRVYFGKKVHLSSSSSYVEESREGQEYSDLDVVKLEKKHHYNDPRNFKVITKEEFEEIEKLALHLEKEQKKVSDFVMPVIEPMLDHLRS